MKILTICGSGIGTSGILKVSVERALGLLGLDADVVATHSSDVQARSEDAQVIVTTAEHVEAIGRTFAEVIVVDNILDLDDIAAKLDYALG